MFEKSNWVFPPDNDSPRLLELLKITHDGKFSISFWNAYPLVGISNASQVGFIKFNEREIYGSASLKEIVLFIWEKTEHPACKKQFPEFFLNDHRVNKLIRHAQKSRGNKRARLFSKANRRIRQIYDKCQCTIYN